MEEHILPLLHITSKYKGLVKINESVAGETGGTVITTPVTPNGTFYLTFFPLENPKGKMMMPVTRRLSIGKNMNGLSDDQYIRVCVWPDNIYEVEINPPYYFLPSEEEIYYKEFVAFEFTTNQRQYIASIVRDFNCYVMIEELIRKRTVYAFPLPFEVENAKITLNRLSDIPYLLADGACDKGAFAIIITLKPEMRVVTCELCDYCEAGPDSIVLSGKLENNDYKTIRSFGLYNGEMCLLKEESELTLKGGKTAEDTVKEFLFCIRNNMQNKAMEYLSLSLKEGLSYRDLREFFGEFEAMSPPLVPPRDCRETVWALKYKTKDNIYNARLFCFEMFAARDGRFFIDNIKEP